MDIEKCRINAIKEFLLRLQDNPAALAWLGNIGNRRSLGIGADLLAAISQAQYGGKFIKDERATPCDDVDWVLKQALMPRGPDGHPRLFIASQPEKKTFKQRRQSQSGIVQIS